MESTRSFDHEPSIDTHAQRILHQIEQYGLPSTLETISLKVERLQAAYEEMADSLALDAIDFSKILAELTSPNLLDLKPSLVAAEAIAHTISPILDMRDQQP